MFTRDTFLHSITDLAEVLAPAGVLGFRVPIRELTVAQRLAAVDAAKVYDSAGQPIPEGDGVKSDPTLFWAAIVVQGVLNPETALDADGNIIPGKGTPLLSPLDIPTLAENGKEAVQQLAQQILNLSWLSRESIFQLYQKTDVGQPRPGAGAGDGSGDASGDVEPRSAASGDGRTLDDGTGGRQGDALHHADPDGLSGVHAGAGAGGRDARAAGVGDADAGK